MKRIIVLGIDAMDPAFLERHWADLPNLRRLRDTGDFQRLATTVPPQSPVAWSTFSTGLNPGGHGVFDFIHRNPAADGGDAGVEPLHLAEGLDAVEPRVQGPDELLGLEAGRGFQRAHLARRRSSRSTVISLRLVATASAVCRRSGG